MKIEQFTPTVGRVIIKKTRELTKIVEVERPDYDNAIVENPVPQGEADLEKPPPVVPTKTVKEKATMGIQIGEIAAINPNDSTSHGFEVGDKVAYGFHTLKEFDLVRGKYGLLDIYNVLGTVGYRISDIVQALDETYMKEEAVEDPSFLGTDLRPGAYDK